MDTWDAGLSSLNFLSSLALAHCSRFSFPFAFVCRVLFFCPLVSNKTPAHSLGTKRHMPLNEVAILPE